MTEVRFTQADTLRCRFGLSPLWETVSAVRVLHGGGDRGLYAGWMAAQAGVVERLELRGLRAVQPRVGYTPDFLTPPPKASRARIGTELARVRSTPVERIRRELMRSRDELGNPGAAEIDRMLANPARARDRLVAEIERAWHALIEPDWALISRVLEDDIAHRGSQLTTGGLAALFDDLHPTLSWADDRLIASRYRDHDHELTGQGLLLVPGVFAWPYLVMILDPAYQPALVYPARGAARLWSDSPTPPGPLAKLLGRTRATILVALDPPATTSALAAEYGLALATVAEHLAALADAGLATRRRTGHQVHYRRTDVGQAVIDASVG
ncbi:helix-turn-helix domain-containing protein [Kribbella sandramycini]|uniref:DNA-binding transcriptional ArsR family regulator n=1 Tax=Kribbella sandramycini TaxID=60450 RepID=A0A7Y4KUF2_9ACTN|nr:DNA-binding transcriptional ArsR family regulator [Kribbella sandramycini]NOL38910.1 helix-turn-helix domain-containing protein [Kribbella sandramycini]